MHTKRLVCLLLITALATALAIPALAERGDDKDRKSKNGKTEGTVDGVDVTLEYGRPKVKERTIWGGLVPYGKVWRTGADEATVITFGADVHVAGNKLAAGRYGLFTLPGEKEWTVIFNKTADQWGAYDYDPKQDALRITTSPKEAEHVEEMEFMLEGSSVVLRWEKLAVAFEVKKAG